MILAGIFGSFEQDILFIVIALLLFGKRLPEVAGSMGRKMHQFRRGLDEMKSEITKPIRESIEQPIREAASSARTAMDQARTDIQKAADGARVSSGEMDAGANVASVASAAAAGETPPAASAPAHPFPYPNASRPAGENPARVS